MTGFSLPGYHAILRGEAEPAYQQLKRVPASEEDNPDELLKKKDQYLETPKKPFSLLFLKFKLAESHYRDCRLCERRCRTDRTVSPGTCGVDARPRISSAFLHFGEEPDLVPSFTIFFTGCNFVCVYCQNWEISRLYEEGRYVEPLQVAGWLHEKEQEGARNVNFVGGEPTPAIPFILEVLLRTDSRLPAIWNSNMYMSDEAMSLIRGVFDVYLADLRYGNDDCARWLSGVKNYTRVVRRNILDAYEAAEVIIRHLVLPGHIKCCTEPALYWLKENIPEVNLNVMFQYHPAYRAAQVEEISRGLSFTEKMQVRDLVEKMGFPHAMVG